MIKTRKNTTGDITISTDGVVKIVCQSLDRPHEEAKKCAKRDGFVSVRAWSIIDRAKADIVLGQAIEAQARLHGMPEDLE